MKTNAIVKVISKETKTGTNARGDWSINEYLIKEELEREDGSINETYLTATAGNNTPELEIGGEYNCNIFITSNEYQGKYYPKFRITHAELVSLPEKALEPEIVESEKIDDTLPF